MQHQEAAFPAAVLLPEAQAARPALLQHTENRPPAAVHHQDTAEEVPLLQPEAAVRHHTTEVLHTTEAHRIAVEVHQTTVAVHLRAAVTAEEVHTHPEVHLQVVTAEAAVLPAVDTEDKHLTITS